MSSPYYTPPPLLTVSELNRHAKAVLENTFPLLWVGGEISNFTRASSGHCYFSLKDSQAQVRCAMFRQKTQHLDFQPANGMQVEVRALVTLYEARGEYQLSVESMRRAGLGALFEAFAKLKARLEKEGCFDPARKKPLPSFPRRIGIVTSPAAAALRDVLSTLHRRMPALQVVLYPTPVQGEGAAEKIAQAIRIAGRRAECDVLIVCRGGGSIEDLWAFNEETIARAVDESPIPIISGVGHETDFTICDFVADRRAPTPTAAAELASPDRAELRHRLDITHARLARLQQQGLEQRMQRLDYLARRLVHPGTRLQHQQQRLTHLRQRLETVTEHELTRHDWRLQQLARRLASATPEVGARQAHLLELARRLNLAMTSQTKAREALLHRLQSSLTHLNPQSVLERGFSVVRGAHGGIVRDSGELALDEQISIAFAHGQAEARVTSKEGTP